MNAGLGLSVAGAAAAAGYWGLSALHNPCAHRSDPRHGISPELLARVWMGIDPKAFIDMHVHVFGNVSDEPGAQSWVNPEMTQVSNPFLFAHFAVFADASCVLDRPLEAGTAYVGRLMELVDEFPPGARFMLLALDGWHDTEGNWVRGTVCTAPRTPAPGCCVGPLRSSPHLATKWQKHSSRRHSPGPRP